MSPPMNLKYKEWGWGSVAYCLMVEVDVEAERERSKMQHVETRRKPEQAAVIATLGKAWRVF